MKNKVIILLMVVPVLVIFPLQTSKCQIADGLGAANSVTATNTGIQVTQLATIITVIENMRESASMIEKAINTIEAVDQIREGIKLLQLIEATICGMEEYQMYLEFSIKHNSCLVNFDYQLINAKLSFTTNIINIASKAASLLSSGERVNSIKDAVAMLEGTMKKVKEHNDIVHSQIEADVMTAYNQYLMESLYKINI